MASPGFTDTEAIDELARWWATTTGGDPDGDVNGADLVDVVRGLLNRVRPTRTAQLTCPECGHDMAEHYGQRRRESYPTPRFCRGEKADGRGCRCRYAIPQTVADAPVGGGYRALPRMRLVWLSGRRHPREAPVNSAQGVFELLRDEAAGLTREVFWTVYLDGRNRVIDYSETSVGSLTATLVHPREVFTSAMHVGAAGIILAHNHPSGDPEPSAEDLSLTKRLVDAGEVVGIKVLDHVVLGDSRFVSFSERGRI